MEAPAEGLEGRLQHAEVVGALGSSLVASHRESDAFPALRHRRSVRAEWFDLGRLVVFWPLVRDLVFGWDDIRVVDHQSP